jgi:hypothetical protein
MLKIAKLIAVIHPPVIMAQNPMVAKYKDVGTRLP